MHEADMQVRDTVMAYNTEITSVTNNLRKIHFIKTILINPLLHIMRKR